MVNIQSPHLDRLFFALSDPTRRLILTSLGEGSKSIGALAAPFQISLAGISKHIKILEEAQLLSREKKGRVHECKLNYSTLRTAKEALHFYTQFWNEKLDQFGDVLESGMESQTKIETKNKSKGRK